MSITLGPRSLSRLAGVHPDLVRVVKRAAEMAHPAEDFTIIQGVRTKQEMYANYGKGRTIAECVAKGVPASYANPTARKVTWLNDPLMSNHRLHPDGYGHAVDLAPYPIDWNDIGRFKDLVALMRKAAIDEGVRIRCGADFKTPDLPHFELAA